MTRRGARPCPIHGCPELQPCPSHRRIPWAGMGHSQRLGKSGWQREADNERILRRYRRVCHVCGQGGATTVDHVIPLAQGGPDTDANKRPIHQIPCHRDKTKAEAAEGRQRGDPHGQQLGEGPGC